MAKRRHGWPNASHWSLIPNVSIQLQLSDEFNIILYDLVQLTSNPVQSISDGIERRACVLCQNCGQKSFPKLFCYHCTPLRKALLYQSGWIFGKVSRGEVTYQKGPRGALYDLNLFKVQLGFWLLYFRLKNCSISGINILLIYFRHNGWQNHFTRSMSKWAQRIVYTSW